MIHHCTLLTLTRFIHKQHQGQHDKRNMTRAAGHWLGLGTGSITLKGMTQLVHIANDEKRLLRHCQNICCPNKLTTTWMRINTLHYTLLTMRKDYCGIAKMYVQTNLQLLGQGRRTRPRGQRQDDKGSGQGHQANAKTARKRAGRTGQRQKFFISPSGWNDRRTTEVFKMKNFCRLTQWAKRHKNDRSFFNEKLLSTEERQKFFKWKLLSLYPVGETTEERQKFCG